MAKELKSSHIWLRELDGILITNPLGWDRKNFHNSFYSEKITKKEFEKRLNSSEFTRISFEEK